MYTITGLDHDKYRCAMQIQDGVEIWTEEGLNKAIDSVINAAKVMNGTVITRKDISFSGHNVADESSRNRTIQKRKNLIWDTRQAIENFREAMRGSLRGARIGDAEELHDELRSAMHELEPWMPDRNVSFASVISRVESEFHRATNLHGSFNSTHEGYAIIQEELISHAKPLPNIPLMFYLDAEHLISLSTGREFNVKPAIAFRDQWYP